MMMRVAVGKAAGGFEQAVRIRSRKEWYRHKMGRWQLVGILGQRVHACRQVVAERCWWRGKRFGGNGQDKQWRTQSGEERSRDSGGQWDRQQ